MKIFGLFSFLECVDNVLRRLGKDISDSELMTLNKLNRHQLGKHNRQRETSALIILLIFGMIKNIQLIYVSYNTSHLFMIYAFMFQT